MEKHASWLNVVLGWVVLAAIWLLLTDNINMDELVAGTLVALLVAFITASHLKFLGDVKLTLNMPVSLIRYLLIFTRALIEANVDMARRILSPDMPIYPEIVEVETRLRSPLGKLILANSITLTPGTLTVDVIDDILYVHWIDTRGAVDRQQATQLIAARFEKHLAGIFK